MYDKDVRKYQRHHEMYNLSIDVAKKVGVMQIDGFELRLKFGKRHLTGRRKTSEKKRKQQNERHL